MALDLLVWKRSALGNENFCLEPELFRVCLEVSRVVEILSAISVIKVFIWTIIKLKVSFCYFIFLSIELSKLRIYKT